jgi:hypothetical protein
VVKITPSRFNLGKEFRYPMNRRLGVTLRLFGLLEKRKILATAGIGA